jgi:hypothetical protein
MKGRIAWLFPTALRQAIRNRAAGFAHASLGRPLLARQKNGNYAISGFPQARMLVRDDISLSAEAQ